MSVNLHSDTLSLSECRNVLKRHNLHYRHLDKKSPIREARNITIDLSNSYGKHLYFIKKCGFHYDTSISLESEIWFYKFIDKYKEFSIVRRFVPQLICSDEKLLILENLHQFDPIYNYLYLPYKTCNFLTNLLAKSLAILHGKTHRLDYRIRFKNIPVSNTYIPNFDRITPETLSYNNDSFIEILEIMQDKLVTSTLNKLRICNPVKL